QIEALISEGLDGLEVWHRGHLPEQRERLLGICARYHFLVTGGSGWHGKGKTNLVGGKLTDLGPVAEIGRRGARPLYP
ncbi:UNVERIFIED_CONTAM: phosphatase, partial [Bifidobacterium breve]|nr:phosphatase [Bifidobacterium breve]